MSDYSVEKMSECFVHQVYEIENDLMGNANEQTILKTIESECLNYYILLESDKVIGFFECKILSPEAELYSIAIDKNFQGKGLSNILMNEFIKIAIDYGCDTILLEVNRINNKAINLYKKYGFSEYGKRKNYYGDNDAILMKKELI